MFTLGRIIEVRTGNMYQRSWPSLTSRRPSIQSIAGNSWNYLSIRNPSSHCSSDQRCIRQHLCQCSNLWWWGGHNPIHLHFRLRLCTTWWYIEKDEQFGFTITPNINRWVGTVKQTDFDFAKDITLVSDSDLPRKHMHCCSVSNANFKRWTST